MPKKKDIQAIDTNLHIKGSLLVDGKIGSKLQQEALVVMSQQDLCYDALSSFVPILIPEGSLVEELNLDLPHLYNRHLQILNLSGHTVRLVVPNNETTSVVNLSTNRHANVTIFATCKILHTVVDIQISAAQEPEPACLLTYTLVNEDFTDFANRITLDVVSQTTSTPDSTTIPTKTNPPTIVSTLTRGNQIIGTITFQLYGDTLVVITSDNLNFCNIINNIITPPVPVTCSIEPYLLPSGQTVEDLANYLASAIDATLQRAPQQIITRTQVIGVGVRAFTLATTVVATNLNLAVTNILQASIPVTINVSGATVVCRAVQDALPGFGPAV